MSKTVTLRLSEEVYELFKELAQDDNRPLSNYIETVALRYIEEESHIDEFESSEILANKDLQRSLKRGLRDAKARRGKIV